MDALDPDFLSHACSHLPWTAVDHILRVFANHVWVQAVRGNSKTWEGSELTIGRPIDAAGLNNFHGSIPLLRVLRLRGPQPMTVEWFQQMRLFCNLTELSITNCSTWPQSGKILQQGWADSTNNVQIVQAHAFGHAIKRLDLSGCRGLTDELLGHVLFHAPLAAGPLSHSASLENHTSHTREHRFPQLEELVLADCTALTEHSWILLHALCIEGRLTKLTIDGCDAMWRPFQTREVTKVLLDLCSEMKNLIMLKSRRCVLLNDVVLHTLLMLVEKHGRGRPFPQLQFLDVSGCGDLSSEGVKTMSKLWGAHLVDFRCLHCPLVNLSALGWFAHNRHRKLRNMHICGARLAPHQLHQAALVARGSMHYQALYSGNDLTDRIYDAYIFETQTGDGDLNQFLDIVGPNLQSLFLSHCQFTRALEATIPRLTHLRTLALPHHAHVTAQMLNAFTQLPELESLDISAADKLDTVALNLLAGCVNLTELDVSDNDHMISDAFVQAISQPNTSPWRRLRLRNAIALSDTAIHQLLSQVGTNLLELDLRGCTSMTLKSVILALSHCTHLQCLGINIASCTDDVIKDAIATGTIQHDKLVRTLPHLSRLWIEDWNVTHTENNKLLWQLIGNAGGSQLAELQVQFRQQSITERRVMVTMGVALFPLLESLLVTNRENNVVARWNDTDLLAVLTSCPFLRELRLYQPSHFSVQAIQMLADHAHELSTLHVSDCALFKQHFHADSFQFVHSNIRRAQQILLHRLSDLRWEEQIDAEAMPHESVAAQHLWRCKILSVAKTTTTDSTVESFEIIMSLRVLVRVPAHGALRIETFQVPKTLTLHEFLRDFLPYPDLNVIPLTIQGHHVSSDESTHAQLLLQTLHSLSQGRTTLKLGKLAISATDQQTNNQLVLRA